MAADTGTADITGGGPMFEGLIFGGPMFGGAMIGGMVASFVSWNTVAPVAAVDKPLPLWPVVRAPPSLGGS